MIKNYIILQLKFILNFMTILFKKLLIVILILFFSNYLNGKTFNNIKNESSNFKTSKTEDKIYDPIEPFNRIIFSFNNAVDKSISEPASKEYKKLPTPIQTGISNFLSNLRMPLVFFNQLLQGQGKNASESAGRFLFNSTIGVFGLIDIADKIGLEEKDEDFGQTFATWGMADGFYLVLPFFGPSTVRDSAGMILTMTIDPINTFALNKGETWVGPSRTAGNAVVQRSKIIDEVNSLRNDSIGYYYAVRHSYYQKRKVEINNTNNLTSLHE